MSGSCKKQLKYTKKVSVYLKSHWMSLGLFLSAYGALYLSSVILNRQTTSEWIKAVAIYSPTSFNPLLPRSFLDLLFLVTSLPALVIGAMMLSSYSLSRILPEGATNKQYVAILLTGFGFTYQIIGAWPLEQQIDFPWQWQKQIVSFGPALAWTLYLMSLIILLIGVVSLYKHSVIYQQQCRENDEDDEKITQ